MSILAVIPARYASTRLPGKPLVPLGGVPLVLRVLEGLRKCRVDRIVVATDHDIIREVVQKAGGEVMMTPKDLASGGDRVAWVAREIPEASVVLNVQVDDPFVGPDMIDPLVAKLQEEGDLPLALLAKKIENPREVEDPNIVKMVFDARMRALYFSRSPIPYPRNAEGALWYKHIGPYAYRRDFLLRFASWEPTPLERTESLEMLRILEKGYPIGVVPVERDTLEIDTPEDVERCEAYLSGRGDS
jgi:3-deoxy-manno-octulosonate cytidylyltransferase (CMP-KDO synthetase)